jgi:prevent-host-death family protein
VTPKPDIVVRAGKPAAVILDIDDYEELLDRVEDAADLKRLRAMRRRPLSFKSLRTYLSERKRRV